MMVSSSFVLTHFVHELKDKSAFAAYVPVVDDFTARPLVDMALAIVSQDECIDV